MITSLINQYQINSFANKEFFAKQNFLKTKSSPKGELYLFIITRVQVYNFGLAAKISFDTPFVYFSKFFTNKQAKNFAFSS